MNDEIRRELKLALYDQGTSIKSLAEELGVSRQQLSRVLNGHSDTDSESWIQIATKVGKKFILTD